MAGFREFVTGEVLTAANVDDFLAKQAVMKFADAAARDSALGTAVASGNALREGMVAYLDDTDEVIKYDGSAWAALGNPGIGSNVVQTVKDDTFSTASTTFTDITGLSATITPTLTSSFVLVTLHIGTVDQSGDNVIFGDCTRDTTAVGIGAAEGSRGVAGWCVTTNLANRPKVVSWSFLDAPNKDTATVYQARIRSAGGTAFINRSNSDSNVSTNPRTIATLTLIEVAA